MYICDNIVLQVSEMILISDNKRTRSSVGTVSSDSSEKRTGELDDLVSMLKAN